MYSAFIKCGLQLLFTVSSWLMFIVGNRFCLCCNS